MDKLRGDMKNLFRWEPRGPENRTLSGRSSGPSLPTTGDLGSIVACPGCGEEIELREMPGYGGRTLRYWSDCRCLSEALERDAKIAEAIPRLLAQQHGALTTDLSAIEHLTLDTFDKSTLVATNGGNPHDVAVRWLDRISQSPEASYHGGPPVALYFHSQGKGRGKTHLAAGIALEARKLGKLVAWCDEVSYIERYWAADLEEKARLSRLMGERAWLTVLDDLGQRENTPASLRDAWYDVVNPRWLERGWTIITSNRTLDELLGHGTINEATYSRLAQMTRSQVVEFTGTDQRLV